MSLREIANETLANYNPATDSPSDMDNIPEGEYDVYVDKIGHRVYDSGYDCVNVMAKVVGGDYDGRVENININIDPDYEVNQKYPGLLSRNIKLISQLSYATGVELTDDDWEDQVSVGEKFAMEGMGAQFVLVITESTSKKGKTYRNYEFQAYESDVAPETPHSESIEIGEEDLPF